MKKNQSGITLIALVITIIVLLILAGVSISTISGENGIVSKAKEAAEKTETVKKEEEDYLKELENHINNSTDEKNEYGFYFDKEYICPNYSQEGSIAKVTFKENNTFSINVFEKSQHPEGTSVSVIDFTEAVILTIDSIEYNKEYTCKACFDSDCTVYYDNNGNFYQEYLIPASQVKYLSNTVQIGNGVIYLEFTNDGKTFSFNGKNFTIEE